MSKAWANCNIVLLKADLVLLPVVLHHSWQGSKAPNISYSQLRRLYPEIDVYLEHWLSFEFWSSVLDGVLAFSRLVGAFDWDWQKALEDCKQKNRSNRLIEIINVLIRLAKWRRLSASGERDRL
ncbi:MAG: hypothetical protein F6K47_11555 [Symploca sp. SIO2E6]|nr:hypothetical protein [Symploca sp. SIO2E6]